MSRSANLNEHKDAEETRRMVEEHKRKCITIPGDIGDEQFCQQLVEQTVRVNNAAEQHPQDSIENISAQQLERTFRTNIFAMFFLTKAALKHLKKGSAVVNTTSVTAYKDPPSCSTTPRQKVRLSRSHVLFSQSLAEKGIRVNGVAPGPIWTPLIPSTFGEAEVATFVADVPLKRPGQPEEVAPSYVFLASDDSSYMTGQILHPNGGSVING